MRQINVVFMGTPDFAVYSLRALHKATGVNVSLVISQPDRPAGRGKKLRSPAVVDAANSLGLDVYQPESMKSPEAARRLRELAPDIAVVVAYGQILRPDVLEIPTYGCVNVHASLLPRWRGAAPIHHAVRSGDAVTGVSIMEMDAGLDTGPVYATGTAMIGDTETTGSLHDRLAELGANLLVATLDDILNPGIIPTPQPNARSNYAPMLGREDREVNFSVAADQVAAHINGMSPWPACYCCIDGTNFNLFGATPLTSEHEREPGTVVAANSEEGLVIACSEGAVEITELQRSGKRRGNARDLLNGYAIDVGALVTRRNP